MNATTWLEGFSSPDRWRDLLRTRAPQIATWVLALALGVQAAVIVTDLAGAARPPLEPTPPPLASIPKRSVNVAAIVNGHLFGAAETVAEANAADAPQTSMPLVLTGIIAAHEPRSGLAILGESAAAAKVYAVGDPVPGGARLHSVLADRVLLDRGGRLESLSLPRQSSVAVPLPRPAAPPPVAGPAENPALERMRRLVTDDPGLIAEVMRPQAVFAQGKQRGFRVYPGRNRQAFLRLGLRPGDLVTAINGTPLDDPARSQEIFRTLGSSSEARVTVMRNGRQQDLTLNVAQIAAEAEQMVGEGAGPAQPVTAIPSPEDEGGASTE